jgi:hypothetical protein
MTIKLLILLFRKKQTKKNNNKNIRPLHNRNKYTIPISWCRNTIIIYCRINTSMTYYYYCSRFRRFTSIFHPLFCFFFHIFFFTRNTHSCVLPWNAVISVIYTARDRRSIYFHCINEGIGGGGEENKRKKVYRAALYISTRATRSGNVARLIVSIRRGVVERQFLLATRETFESPPRRRITHVYI